MPYAQQLGRYQLLDRIAFGGMAEIFRAKTFDHEGRAHLVAVKRVLNHLVCDEDFLRMLVDEAKLSAQLTHQNIAQVYEFAVDHGENGDEYFIAMEYVDGKDVRTLLDRHRAQQKMIPPEHVAWIGMEMAHALHAAHIQHDPTGRPLLIVHRDVSPSNVLLSYRGEVKLCDFGIAKAATTRVQTKTGVIKGKVKYMSPEQAMGRKLDHRSDLFSLGTVLYEMLTLQAPFSAATEVELIFAVRDARKADARVVAPSVPEELDQLLNKLMSRSRSQRFQSGQELAQALKEYLDRAHPGYRRSNFGRYMRALFEADIEKELRQLEEYIIDGGDPDKVGENLIADALGEDAPYTKFTAAGGGGSRESTGHYGGDSPLGDLHSEPTQILAGAERRGWRPEPTTPEPLAEQSTRILDPARPRLHEEPTGPRALPELHQQPTQILDFAGPGGLHAQPTRILDRGVAPSSPSPSSSSLAEREFDEADPLDPPEVLEEIEAIEAEPYDESDDDDDGPTRHVDDVDTRAPTVVPAMPGGTATNPHPTLFVDDDTPETSTQAERPRPRLRRDTLPGPLPDAPDAAELADGEEPTAVNDDERDRRR